MSRAAWLSILPLAVIARLVYGPGAIGYDASYAAVWGRQLAHGTLPAYRTALAPTPHPLTVLLGAAGSLAGLHAFALFAAVGWLSLGAVAWGGGLLGARLFGWPVGVVTAAILLTRPTLVNETAQAIVDIPFLALVLSAGAVLAADRRRWRLALVLLALGGLLRPEGWALAALTAVALWSGLSARERGLAVALVLAGPELWMLSDLAVTGDALWSLHGTRELAETLQRPRGLGNALRFAPTSLRDLVGAVVGFGGLAGLLVLLWERYDRALAPAAVVGLGLLGFLVLGIAGLPVLARYLLVPAAGLALFCAAGVAGWADAERRPVAWLAGAAVLAVALLASLPTTAGDLGDLRRFLAARRTVQAQLNAATDDPRVRAAVARCGSVAVPEYQPVPLVAYWLERPPGAVAVGHADGGVAIDYATPAVGRILSLTPRAPAPPLDSGGAVVHSSASWRVSGCAVSR